MALSRAQNATASQGKLIEAQTGAFLPMHSILGIPRELCL